MAPTWLSDATCRDADPELFFEPNRWEPREEKRQREERAKGYCAECPVRDACRLLADVQESGLEEARWFGIWGGETRAERRRRRGVSGPTT